MKDQIEKQAIEEIENDLRECHTEFPDENMNIYTDYSKTAEKMVAKGYRKQSEGEWIDANPNGAVYKFTCTLCGETKLGKETPYCPNCGAHMK